MPRLDLTSYLSLFYSENFQTTTQHLTTNFNTIPNISSVANIDYNSHKRNHQTGKQHPSAIRSSSLGFRHISHEIQILAITEKQVHTHTFSRQLPRSSFLFPPSASSVLLPATPESLPLSDLQTGKNLATRLLRNKLLVHQSIRVARFLLFPLKVSFPYLVSLLASLGQLAPCNLLHAAAPSPSRFSEAEPMLECAQCDAVVPLSHLKRHKPRSATSYTAELLSQVLAPQHLEQCSGRKGGELLRDDDTQLAVPAVSEFQLLPSKTIDSLSGMTVLLNFYWRQ